MTTRVGRRAGVAGPTESLYILGGRYRPAEADSVSEYQVYDFVAVDRPLTRQEMVELRAISTRAEISSTRFWNEYHWGSLKVDPRDLLARYFDVHLYTASWGERHFMVRLPAERIDRAALRPYLGASRGVLTKSGRHYILALTSPDDAEPDDDELGMVDTAGLVSLRAGLLHGDKRVPYLAWLLAVQSGLIPGGAHEPPVPPGLRPLSGPLAALAEFLQLDPFLLEAGSEASAPECADPAALRRWLARLPAKEKDRWLSRAVERPDEQLGAELLAAFARATTPDAPGPRTVGQLIMRTEVLAALAEQAAEAEEARAAKRQAEARQRHLAKLAREGERAWKRLESLVAISKYGDAVNLAMDLYDLAIERRLESEYLVHIEGLKQRQGSRRGFFTRLREQVAARPQPGASSATRSPARGATPSPPNDQSRPLRNAPPQLTILR